jgi:hypothetical protein
VYILPTVVTQGIMNQCIFIGLAYHQGKDIVFRFIIEYSSLRGFGPPPGSGIIFIGGFLKDDIFWLVLKLEISYKVIIIS